MVQFSLKMPRNIISAPAQPHVTDVVVYMAPPALLPTTPSPPRGGHTTPAQQHASSYHITAPAQLHGTDVVMYMVPPPLPSLLLPLPNHTRLMLVYTALL